MTSIATFKDDLESARVTRVVETAADAAYRRRARLAESAVVDGVGRETLVRRRRDAGLDELRWVSLLSSSRTASPDEFQAFAAALGVSARWLAVGSGSMAEPPEGWSIFGTHVDVAGRLEFSSTLDPSGLPLWERPTDEVAA
ncbi:hypothetical protein OVA26_16160 [Microbacterium sp. SL62]|uniref:hypothetical protein n=1 Tax=Microbacterium sp. SL62 TaxID=2995139 RepID=UPI0022764B15|nr:hypothetical protein [Microbacterium sp. SL62]MCY1718470.1 hypothetical protein [Microbacterium sp. SL62]